MGTILTDDVNLKLCEGCADCCKYVAIEIDKPEKKSEHEQILSYLMHEGVRVFVEEDEDDDDEQVWYIEFRTKCDGLGDDLLCMTYETRPNMCREYSPKDCPRNNPDGDGDLYQFNSPEDYLVFLRIRDYGKKIKLPMTLSNEVRVDLDQPTDNEDVDNIAWYLLHANVSVFNNSSNEWFIQFTTTPKKINNIELYTDLLENPQQQVQIGDAPVQKTLNFSMRKEYLEYLKTKGIAYTLKQAKGMDRRPPQLQSAIPIVSM